MPVSTALTELARHFLSQGLKLLPQTELENSLMTNQRIEKGGVIVCGVLDFESLANFQRLLECIGDILGTLPSPNNGLLDQLIWHPFGIAMKPVFSE